MRNFYNQPTSKIFDKMFGKGARQLQADPNLDLSKCKCCECDKFTPCKGCIEGHVLKYDLQDQGLIDAGQLKAGGCCHGPDSALIFEYERPGGIYSAEECCPPSPQNNNLGARRCCGTQEVSRSNVRFYYNYIGQYFKMDYNATGRYNTVWPNNGMPRLCSKCNPSSCDAARSGTFPGSQETCLDYMPTPSGGPIDDQVPDPDAPCSTIGVQWDGCQCMGNGRLAISNRTQKRLSYYRKREMERSPYYRWLADIMCYDRGNVVANPTTEWFRPSPFAPVQERQLMTDGSLYQHLVAVVHCEHWYEMARCPENPEHDDGFCLGAGTQAGCVNTSVYSPRFWVYACSGVPLFDFEIKEAQEKGLLPQDLYLLMSEAIADNKTPPQRVMQALAKGGYLDVGDWRTEALSEITQLRSRKYTATAYGGSVGGNPDIGACCINNATTSTCLRGVSAEYCSLTGGVFFPRTGCVPSPCNSCSTLDPLGPVRKRFWADNIGVQGVFGPSRLDPAKARSNIVSSPRGAIIEEIIDASTDPTLRNLQLPSGYFIDPWNGRYPTLPPNPTPSQIEEYDDFLYWRGTQWLYMHARPGGWDYVCPGYSDPANPDPTLTIPDLPRKFSNIPGVGGCLNGLLGSPVDEFPIQGGCSQNLGCGDFDQNGVFQPYPLVGCNQGGPCFSLACSDQAEPYCTLHPEKGGKDSYCREVSLASNCNGIRFQYSTHRIARLPSTTISLGYQDVYVCDKKIDAFLFRVNITKGNYDSFCPFTCRTLQIPKLIERNIPKLSMSVVGYENACTQSLSSVITTPTSFNAPLLCPGRFCFNNGCGLNPSTGLPNPCPGTYGGFIPFFTFNPSCCGKTATGLVELPLPSRWQHDASNRQLCPLYPGPGYPTLYDGQFLGIPVDFNSPVCCWGCNQNGNPPVYFGVKDEFECRNILIQNGFGWQVNENLGRGQIYTCTSPPCNGPGIQLQDPTRCNDLTAQCACATRTQWANLGCPLFN